ncbi:MAG: endonuclease/exonuclease/phosphatase family protein [Polyangiaceae bacterium]|nr:endonuclease/exonuclease/phosphatase family protein [Myxococcales bacterium]MCB9587516.1 endonuclease/exonuclease/phosphatase family protein [Polyangiaceae bacterium]MCB9605687.1 endonuclease/exonuclease/phosphatase family protein [Polyangiaceae bacterium]
MNSPASRPIRFATYNVRMLVLEGPSRGRRPQKSDASWRAVAAMIDATQADVLALQEVGSVEALDRLQGLLRDPYPQSTFCPSNSSLGIHLAVLSRFTFAISSHRETVLWDDVGNPLEDYPTREASRDSRLEPLRFQRDFPRVSVDVGSGVELFVAHLKSLRSYAWMRHTAGTVRNAEARAAARLMRRHLQKPCLVMGDFNAAPRDPTLEPLLGNPELWDPVAEELEPDGVLVPSYRCGAHTNRIDFALLGPQAKQRYVSGSARIHRGELAEVASDHYPLSVDVLCED